MDNKDQIYVIKEQGDMNLFADPVSEEDQKTIEENFEQNWKKENE